MPYVDGFVIPLPKKNVEAYRRMARMGARTAVRDAKRARVSAPVQGGGASERPTSRAGDTRARYAARALGVKVSPLPRA